MPQTTYTANAGTTGFRRAPNQLSLLLHIGKTAGLVQAVLRDARVHWLPKMVFVGCLGALVLAVLFPELTADTAVFFGLPGVGAAMDVLGIPAEGVLDWTVVAVAAFNLLKLFPTEIVGEHYDTLFRRRR